MNTNRKRVSVPFAWRASDGVSATGALLARSYGSEIAGVLTRAGAKWVPTQNGLLVPRVHSELPFAWLGGARALLVEQSATNLCLRSSELDNAAWANVGTPVVTANTKIAPDGTTMADTIADTSGAETRGRRQTIVIAADTAKYAASIYVKKRTSAHSAGYVILNLRFQTGGATVDAYGVFDIFNGTAAKNAAADRVAIEAVGSYWRISIAATNSNDTDLLFSVYPGGMSTYTASTDVTGQGTEIFWGAQVESVIGPTSYIPTTSSSAGRQQDTCYWDFAMLPQTMTVYCDLLDMGTRYVTGYRYLQISNSANNAARLLLQYDGTNVAVTHDPTGGAVSTAGVAVTHALNDRVEMRAVLNADGSVNIGTSINGAAEATAGPGAAQAIVSTWSTPTRLYLLGVGSGGANAVRSVIVATGVRTLTEMRALAGIP